MPSADFNNQIGQLKSKLDQISRKVIKCEDEQKKEKVKLMNAGGTKNEEEVRIYTVSVQQKHDERTRYLRLKNSLQHCIDCLEFLATFSEIKQSVTTLTNLLESSLATENYQAMVEAKDSIDKLKENMVKDESNRAPQQLADDLPPASPNEQQQQQPTAVNLKEGNQVIEKRMAELEEFEKNPPDSCSAGLVDEDIYHWQGIIVGPPRSPFVGGVFLVRLKFSSEDPSGPPEVSFETKVFHPNVDSNGTICLDILKEKWSPDLSISKVLLSIKSLLTDPDIDNPLVPEIAHLYKTDRAKYETTARSWTQEYAMG